VSPLDEPLPLNDGRLLLIRHGQTAYNAEGRAQGWLDTPLTPLGYRQAEATATKLVDRPLAAIYSSPLQRALATALAIGRPHGLVPRPVADLKEVHTGALTGRTWDEAEQVFPDAVAAYRRAEAAEPHPRHRELIPGWEPIAVFLTRVWTAMRTIAAAHPGETVAVVCHGGVLSAFLTHAVTGAGLDRPWEYRHDNVAVSEVLLHPPGLTLASYNQVLHAVTGPGDVIF
jgi:probable phosphoglycerate mutase